MNAQTKVERPKTLAAALVAAQDQLHAPVKNRTVKVRSEKGSYSFDYATLDAIVEQVLRPALPARGLWFVQFISEGQMITRIVHESGEQMDCGIPMPNLPAKPQEAGSLISYFKRYSLCAAFGLVAEEDDDGNVAQGNAYEAQARDGAANGALIDDAQFAQLVTLGEAVGADVQRFCAYMKVPSLKQMPASRFNDAVAALNAKAKPAKQPKEKEPA